MLKLTTKRIQTITIVSVGISKILYECKRCMDRNFYLITRPIKYAKNNKEYLLLLNI